MYRKMLEKNIRDGVLNLQLPSGERLRVGKQGREASWVIHSNSALRRIARDWDYELGETYVEGAWDVVDCKLEDLLALLRSNFTGLSSSRLVQMALKALQQWNRVARAYRNVSHHYDLEESFFRQFLDEDMHYSCAYFPFEGCTLEQAQQAKCALIADKLLLKPGHRVLDIGCGWGSLAMFLAERYDVEVVGITLSKEQLAAAQRRAKARKVSKVKFLLQDYREHRERYDRIVSVGMFEHVGRPYYHTFFDCVRQMLAEEGVALIHTIGRGTPPTVTNPWIAKHIFPGGYIPAMSEMSRGVEDSGLITTDVEVLRLHYAETLRHWSERFRQHREEIVNAKGERFFRMWEFYLAASEVSFRVGDLMVLHFQLARRNGVVPITRDYLLEAQSVAIPGQRQGVK